MSSRAAIDLIMQELAAARAKHPHFANSLEQGLVALASEHGELASAILKGDIHGQHGVIREAAQVAAVAIRIIKMCQHIRTCTNCGNDGPGFICEAGHDTEGERSDCRDWTPKQEAHHG